MPIRSPRRLYLINEITVDVDDDPNVIDKSPGDTTTQTTKPIIAKIKESIGNYLGIEPLAYNDPIFTGVFGGEGLNKNATYRRVLGGFRDASYTLVAETNFEIVEQFYNNQGEYTTETNNFKTMSIGFPKGHSVTEVIAWLETTDRLSDIRSIITPAGHKVDLFVPAPEIVEI